MGRRGSRHIVGRWLWFLTLAVAAAALVAALDGLASGPAPEGPLSVAVVPVPFDRQHPGDERAGGLLYRGGLWLRSQDARFGGLSDLRVSADGRDLHAVSDCGYGFTARLSYDVAGRLSGLDEPEIADLVGIDHRPLKVGERDAESLVVRGGSLEVGFEGRPRIWAYSQTPPFAGPARPIPSPSGLSGCGANGGIEAMTLIDATRRLLLCETRRSSSRDVPAWVGDGTTWRERSYPLLFRNGWTGEPYRATAAALLPDGDVLVLERRFPPIGARVVRLARSDIEGDGPLHPRELAAIEAPLSVDNFEGIDVRHDDTGRTFVYLLSDDNNCAKKPGGLRGSSLQKTLLLMFEMEG